MLVNKIYVVFCNNFSLRNYSTGYYNYGLFNVPKEGPTYIDPEFYNYNWEGKVSLW